MKKIKLIMPIVAITPLVVALPLSICNWGGDPTSTNNVKAEYDFTNAYRNFQYSDPQVDESFSFSLNILNDYVVNYAKSKIFIGDIGHSLNSKKITCSESSDSGETSIYFTVYPELMKSTKIKVVFSSYELNKFSINGNHNVDPDDNNTLAFTCDNPNVNWSIDDTSVGTVDQDGKFTPNKKCVNRFATLTATDKTNPKQIARFEIELGSFSKLKIEQSTMPAYYECKAKSTTDTKGDIIIPTKYYSTTTNEWINVIYSKTENSFLGCNELVSVNFPMSTALGGFIMLNKNDFKGCSKLESINWDAIAGLNNSAFEGCEKLNNVKLNYLLSGSISESCFKGCKGLTSLEIGKTIENILSNAFDGCSWLTSVTIPFSVTNISNNAFVNSGLTSAIFENNKAKWLCGSEQVDVDNASKNATNLLKADTVMSLYNK